MKNIKQIVKNKYSKIASAAVQSSCGCSCSGNKSNSKDIGYSDEQLKQVGEADLGLGCGNPTAFSNIKKGDIVVDLGSGAGIDCFLAARKAGSEGKIIGIDFTEEMIAKAKNNAIKGGFSNVEFKLGDIENLPLKDDSTDIIISNCVINLAPNKQKVFNEARRILKPGGKMYVSDIVLLKELSVEQKNDKELIAGCVGRAMLRDKYIELIKKAGFQINILSENRDISKQQYHGIPLESLMVEAVK